MLIERSGVADTVDAAVAEGALRRRDAVVTSNRYDIERLMASVAPPMPIHEV